MKVSVVQATRAPVATVVIAAENMVGKPYRSTQELQAHMTGAEALEKFRGLGNSKLAGPLEFVHFFLQIEDVPRWFTHQLVRTRHASYSQVSMRFNDPTESNSLGMIVEEPPNMNNEQQGIWNNGIGAIELAHGQLLRAGMSVEDARGILPNAVLTTIGMDVSLRTLMGIAETRLCYQAQLLWREFMKQTKEGIYNYYTVNTGDVVPNPGQNVMDMLVVACERYGKCTFNSTYDRPCPIKEAKGW